MLFANSNCWGGRSWIGLAIRRKFRREHAESSVLFKGSAPSPSMPPIGAKLDPPRRRVMELRRSHPLNSVKSPLWEGQIRGTSVWGGRASLRLPIESFKSRSLPGFADPPEGRVISNSCLPWPKTSTSSTVTLMCIGTKG